MYGSDRQNNHSNYNPILWDSNKIKVTKKIFLNLSIQYIK